MNAVCIAGVRGGERGKVGRHSNIGNDGIQVVWLHNLADDVFNFLDVTFREFDPRPRGSLDVDDELARVRARKKRETHQWI